MCSDTLFRSCSDNDNQEGFLNPLVLPGLSLSFICLINQIGKLILVSLFFRHDVPAYWAVKVSQVAYVYVLGNKHMSQMSVVSLKIKIIKAWEMTKMAGDLGVTVMVWLTLPSDFCSPILINFLIPGILSHVTSSPFYKIWWKQATYPRQLCHFITIFIFCMLWVHPNSFIWLVSCGL